MIKVYFFVLWSFVLVFYGCKVPASNQDSNILSANTSLSRIAFGSCSRHDLPQPLWSPILENKPQLWVWLGDNVYGDTEDMSVLKQKYDAQKQNPGYQKLTASVPVIGIWDDHDYGVNDGGMNYPKKTESQQLMLDFLGEPATSSRRKHEGAYGSYVYGSGKQQIKIILLDGRYFREELRREDGWYIANETGSFLGEEQWNWLEKELTGSKAAIHIIACGVQFIPEEQRFEKWANFPQARKRFFDLLVKNKPAGVVLLSGDRHIGEVSRYQPEGMPYPIWEVTSSGLTHSSTNNTGEDNKYRVGALVNQLNFGIMNIDWTTPKPTVNIQIRGKENVLYLNESFSF
ncbi:alkaline phosphatase D family protein [Xanthocytophaga agilis]|uniref:Alkaline phosphatase D family protein n=1 Tax=Xanthocytophaga agilis TaxID=3048010 RepID=A0AAE3QXZ6_9BACT|nr:alkaline phosphatase D family protein [Xanthocytophaga agilis]MDJ1500099.1 alkaline phosphatase D family protein [Xanthocytophaga agilis]